MSLIIQIPHPTIINTDTMWGRFFDEKINEYRATIANDEFRQLEASDYITKIITPALIIYQATIWSNPLHYFITFEQESGYTLFLLRWA